ncbi:MAG: thioredoxin domain-containing protein [Chitinophagaceae bacterium]|nr:thioredoxin domain-containing protein [Chitinophagaceae bacterium]
MHSNRLVNETSPYLLQHAHNPVNWYPWGEEALQKAKQEDKPILVSIGYAACHWCHVMERESFEDETTAAIMIRDFININIDREERPDLDHIYMDAVQAMTGSGGWPLNVFLTPEARPFYGGTYFPPTRAYNRASWQETLLGVTQAFRDRRNEIEAQASNLTEHLISASSFGIQTVPGSEIFDRIKIRDTCEQLMKQADREWGGFGRAPKFPQTFSILYLLRFHYLSGDGPALEQALLSLDKMIEGGIYDQLGGGFARYSTDTEWLAPHFEKMLYDNALLIMVLTEAYQLTGKLRYREVIDETLAFIQREMLQEQGAFYAALDADSEGVEGKFYVWQPEEVQAVLGAEAELFCGYYDVTEKGNWSEPGHGSTNILRVKKPLAAFAAELKAEETAIKKRLELGRQLLLAERAKRVRPQLDDKIILGWNALMNTAISKAFAATGNLAYRELAIRNMNFLLEHFKAEKGYHHTWKAGQAKYPAFLDDYAYLIEALIQLQEITGNRDWLVKARELAEFVQEHFREEGTGFFFYTPVWQEDVIVRKKEVYDGATPSGNAVMALNLYRLGILFNLPEWKEQSANMLAALGNAITRYPTSFGCWACLLQEQISGTNELAMVGEGVEKVLHDVLKEYIPHRVLMASEQEVAEYPLLAARTSVSRVSLYRCSNYTCQLPVFSAKELISLIDRDKKA